MGGRPMTLTPDRVRSKLGLDALSVRVRRRLIAFLVALVLVAAGFLIHPPYVVFRSGPMYNTLGTIDGKQVIDVSGTDTYEVSGDLYFTTVAVYGGRGREINLWDYLVALWQSDTEIRPVDEVFPPNLSREQIREGTRAQMRDAQLEAKAVALRAAGRTVKERVIVGSIVKGGPADGALRKGDRFVSVDGVPISSASALLEVIKKAEPGRKFKMVVDRDGAEVSVEVGTVEKEGRRVVGIGLGTDFDFPVEISINTGEIGGPSAGLMFSLGLYDKITPGSLTGGAKIAGTGTIADNGKVGPIGGIKHKMRGARQDQRADWFLAPAGNCAEAREDVPPGLRVVKVESFDGARRAVEEIAAGRGDELPRCS